MVAGMREAEMDWTAEAIEALRGFWAEGHSTAEIGRRMGISKNAVVGKAHRLNLPPRPSPIRREGEGRPPSAPQPATLAQPTAGMPETSPAALAPEAAAPEARPATPAMAEPPAVDPMVTLPPLVPPAAPLPAPAVAAAPRPAEPAMQPQAPQLQAPPLQVAAPPVAAPRPPVPPRRVAPPTAVVRPFQRSTGRSCCWPIGEPGTPDFRFCTGEAMSSKPYCPEHAAVAYVKARDRREDAA
jgi:GcrA cell cycle regulator